MRKLDGDQSAGDSLFEEGLALQQQGLLDEASRFYDAALGHDPRHFFALHLLGDLRARQGLIELLRQSGDGRRRWRLLRAWRRRRGRIGVFAGAPTRRCGATGCRCSR